MIKFLFLVFGITLSGFFLVTVEKPTPDQAEYTTINNSSPVAVCKPALLELNSSNHCSDTLYAFDFDNGSYDPDGDSLFYRMQVENYCTAKFDTIIEKKLFHQYQSVVKPVIFWVFDNNGNSDSCLTHVNIHDSETYCIKWDGIGTFIHSSTKEGRSICGVDIYFDTTLIFKNVCESVFTWDNSQKTVYLSKSDDPLNGVSTLDIILLRKHILGHEPFTHYEQWIAADVNFDLKISMLDILYLRQLIFNMVDNFPGNHSWRFYDAEFTTDSEYPLGENIPYSIIDSSRCGTTLNFYGVKIGDLSGNASLY